MHPGAVINAEILIPTEKTIAKNCRGTALPIGVNLQHLPVNRPRCRGTALVKLLSVPKDCRCRAPTTDVV